jgi:hypothetical protein
LLRFAVFSERKPCSIGGVSAMEDGLGATAAVRWREVGSDDRTPAGFPKAHPVATTGVRTGRHIPAASMMDRRPAMAETWSGEFYCVKCKEKREASGEVQVNDKGTRMAKAKCPVCGTNLNRILGRA